MKKVAFICVHNSCRSQIAEAIARTYYVDVFEVYSAGTKIKKEINRDAITIIKEMYGIDIEDVQKPKLLDDIPKVDIAITMGCNVTCPNYFASYKEDWGLDDPTGKPLHEFKKICLVIEEKIEELKKRIVSGEIL